LSVGEIVEGERVVEDVEGDPFRCVLFLPSGAEQDRRGRQVKEPTLLYEPNYPDGSPVSLNTSDRLRILAPELNLAQGLERDLELVWQVRGDPQPAGKPGRVPKVMIATLRRVED
jgi:hypothetical protein